MADGNKYKTFEDLEVWKLARDLCRYIYSISLDWKDYSFRDQFRRAGVSVMNNIAEGFDRSGDKEFVRFLYISKSSCSEVRSMSYLALDLTYIKKEEKSILLEKTGTLNKKLGSLIKKIENDIKLSNKQ